MMAFTIYYDIPPVNTYIYIYMCVYTWFYMYCKYNYTGQSAVVYIPNRLLGDCVSNIMEPLYTLVKCSISSPMITSCNQPLFSTLNSRLLMVQSLFWGPPCKCCGFNSDLVVSSRWNPYFLMVNLMKIPIFFPVKSLWPKTTGLARGPADPRRPSGGTAWADGCTAVAAWTGSDPQPGSLWSHGFRDFLEIFLEILVDVG